MGRLYASEGNRMIPLTKPSFDERELKRVKQTLDSGWVAGHGPMNEELSEKFAEYIGVKYAIPISNCTIALYLSLLAMDIKKGDEVIIPASTYPATGLAVLSAGAKIKLVDIDFDYNINENLIEEAITKKTKAIMPVHQFGLCCQMNKIMEIAKEFKLKVIEDAACAIGAEYHGKKAGSFGDVGCFSFHARKIITGGEGGMVTTNNKKIAERIKRLSNFGIEKTYKRKNIPVFKELAMNFRMSDIQAGIILAQLEKVEKFIEKRQFLAGVYESYLAYLPKVETAAMKEPLKHVYQSYVVMLKKDRDEIIEKLRKLGIQTTNGSYALNEQPVFNYLGNFPIAKEISKRSLTLPMYYDMTENDVRFVVTKLKKCLN